MCVHITNVLLGWTQCGGEGGLVVRHVNMCNAVCHLQSCHLDNHFKYVYFGFCLHLAHRVLVGGFAGVFVCDFG